MKISAINISNIIRLCEQYGVSSFSVFGSVVRDDFNDSSDIDCVVDFEEQNPLKYADLYF